MNSYSFGINGSWYVLGLLAFISILIAIWTYRNTVPPISSGKKTLLVSLRSLAILILLFAIFEPVLTSITGKDEDPKLAVLLDNSESMSAVDAGGKRLDQYKDAVAKSNFSSLNENDLVTYSFDSDIRKIFHFTMDSLTNKGQLTNISNSISHLGSFAEDENLSAGLLITDGVFNSGTNPLYTAEKLGIPIYVIGIGDTNRAKDISIQSVLMNEVAYIENPFPINVNVAVNSISEAQAKLIMLDNGVKFAEQVINIVPNKDVYSAVFEYMPKIEGTHKITAHVETIDGKSLFEGEITDKNNDMSEFLKVLKNKRRIAIIAGAPSSDISFIKSFYEKDKSIEVKLFIQKKGAEFYQAPTPADLREAEVLVLVGFPSPTSPDNVINMIQGELSRGKPVFFIAGINLHAGKLAKLTPYLPFDIVQTSTREYLAIPDVSPNALSNSILRVNGSEEDLKLWNSLPPIFKTETFVKLKPESELIMSYKINNTKMTEPLIAQRNLQNKKSLAVLGYGLYRWKLSGYAPEVAKGQSDAIDLFSIFLQNSLGWLSVDNQNKLVSIKSVKKSYTSGERVEIVAQVYDDAYRPIENADVSVTVSKSPEEKRELILTSIGNGRYNGYISGLAPGDYLLEGNASYNNLLLGKDEGKFSIGDVSLEFQNLVMNVNLLRQIAERTGGKFYLAKDASSFLQDLKANVNFTSRHKIQRKEFSLWNLPYLLAAAIVCFSIEWLIRKLSGMV